MLNNTDLFVAQPLRFEAFKNEDDLLSYAPISDVLLSLDELFSEEAFTEEHFQPKNFDNFGGEFNNTLIGLDATSLDTTSWKFPNFELEAPFESADWLQSPISSSPALSLKSLDASSNSSSMSFNEESHVSLTGKANESNFQSPLSQRFAISPSPDLSQDEVAKLWTMAFPCESRAQISQEATSPIRTGSPPPPARRQYKRKSKSPPPTSADDSAPSNRKKNVEEKVPRRSYQRRNTLTSESSSGGKGSKLNHNLIEKRYRCSLNDKIIQLREAMPKNYGNNRASDEDDVFVKEEDGAETESRQTTKGATLTNAARYIRSLEGKVNKLEQILSFTNE